MRESGAKIERKTAKKEIDEVAKCERLEVFWKKRFNGKGLFSPQPHQFEEKLTLQDYLARRKGGYAGPYQFPDLDDPGVMLGSEPDPTNSYIRTCYSGSLLVNAFRNKVKTKFTSVISVV